jgi:hypothetical protein
MPVSWKTVSLREPQELMVPNGEQFVVANKPAHSEDLSVAFSDGRELTLAGAVDADERFLNPRIHVFAGTDPGKLLFFGGPVAYRVHSDGHILGRLETHRDLADYECGSFEVIAERDIAVIVYEVGILVIGDDLRPRWLRRKYMGQGQVTLEADVIWIRGPHEIPIGHRLSDGELISAPEGYRPGVPRGRVPNESELFEEGVNAWDRPAVMRVFQALASELATLAETGRTSGGHDDRAQLDELRGNVNAQIEKMSKDPAARPDRGFATGLAARWGQLGLDRKRLFDVAMRAAYKWEAR